VTVGFGLLVGRPAGVVRGAGREGFTTVLLGFGAGFSSDLVRFGAAAGALPAGALLAGERGMTCDDDAAGAPSGVVRAGAELGARELVGALLREAEVLDRDGLAVAPASDPLGAAAR
jgi:hypothetical protein